MKGECELFDAIVHGLRSRGWSRIEAEGEALNRIEGRRAMARTEERDRP
jgi:hypothetical protein